MNADELLDLRTQLSKQDEMESREDGFVWKKTGEGPFCPTCYHKDGKIVPLAKRHHRLSADDYSWNCPVCKYQSTIFGPKPKRSTPPAAVYKPQR